MDGIILCNNIYKYALIETTVMKSALISMSIKKVHFLFISGVSYDLMANQVSEVILAVPAPMIGSELTKVM